MKKALKNKKVYIIASILALIGVTVPFIVLIITINSPTLPIFQYPALLGMFAAVYLLIGYIWGDLYTANQRRKTKNWDGVLPEQTKIIAWERRLPFFIASLIVFIVFMVFEIIFWVTGNYPFLG
ncbi:MAG: hypothetical protein SO176_00075 [Bacilli bacterium]|nr:hypothetical protein [Bacilli bacterium]